MLTLLEPPSPASSTGPREINVTTRHSLQATPQLTGPLSIISPPETSSPQKPLDTPDSSKGISALESWFRARFKKTNKNQVTQPPDQLSTRSGRPVNLRSNSRSQSIKNTPQKGPDDSCRATCASECPLRRWTSSGGVSDELSQRTVWGSVNRARCLVFISAPLFILRYRTEEIPRLLRRPIGTRTRPIMDKALEVQRKRAP